MTGRAGDTPSMTGWLVWGLAAVFFCMEFLVRLSPGVMVDELMHEFSVGAGALGALSSFYFYAYSGMQIPIGAVLDRFGPRVLLVSAAGLCAIGTLLFATSHNLATADFGRLISGLGGGASFLVAVGLAALWLPANRLAMVTGLTMTAGTAGAVLAQGPLAYAVEGFGWRASLAAVALALAALVVPIAIFVRDPRVPRPKPKRSLLGAVRIVMRQRYNWMAAFAGCGLSGPMLAFGGLWSVPFLMQTHGLSHAAAANLNALLLVGWGLGGPLIGSITDRIGWHRPPLVGSLAVAALGWLDLAFVSALPVPVIGAIYLLIGIASGGMLISYSMCRAYTSPELASTATGLANTIMIGAGAVLQPAMGALLDLQWRGLSFEGVRIYSSGAFGHAILLFPAWQAVSILMALLLPEVYRGARVRR
ncbi:MAG TPA: MFS transporter [Candidatus Cybelea sp.]|nr:MFS transporter [Candidatus Cybelea sp.]